MRKLVLTLAVVAVDLFVPTALGAENLIENGGFEKSSMNSKYNVQYPQGFAQQYFPPDEIVTDPANVHSGEKAVRLRSDLYSSAQRIETQPGDEFRISVWAKGKGRLELLVFEYDKDNWIIQENILGSAPLMDEYAEISFTYRPVGQVTEKLLKPVANFLPCMRFRNEEEEGHIDDWRMVKTQTGKKVMKEIEKKVIWPDERVILLSEDESKRANLVARSDYRSSPRWRLRAIKGRPFWFTLRTGWYGVPWLQDEPLLKYSMPQPGFDQRRYAALRELELYGPEGGENLARSPGAKLFGKGWKQLNLLADGKAPTETRFEWTRVKDAAYYGSSVNPVAASAGVELSQPHAVRRAVVHHGHNFNLTILGERIAQADIADEFFLEYSPDGTEWREIPGTRVRNNRKPRTEHEFKPVTASAVRVHIMGQASPIPPEKGKAWKNVWWALREHVSRDFPYEGRYDFVRRVLKERPFIGMEPYRRTAYRISGEEREALRRYFDPVMSDFARYYKDTFVGFLMWEWDNDLFKAFRGRPEFDNPKSWKTKYDFMMKGLASASEIYHGYMIPQGTGMRPWGHYMFEAGARAVMEEMKGGYGSGMLQVQTTFMRSAARQYGRLWGTYPTPRLGLIGQKRDPAKSEFFPVYGPGGAGYGEEFLGPARGVSPYWWKRMLFGNYFAGESFQDMELGVGFMVFGPGKWVRGGVGSGGDIARGCLIPQGIATRDFARFAADHSDRGTLYTPIAFVTDYWGGWTQRYASWPGRPLRWGDDEISELMITFFPVAGRNPMGFGYEVANKDMADTPFGECCDVLKPNPPSGIISQEALNDYKILWMAGSWRRMPEALVDRLKAYVRAGGTLVLNAAHVRGAGFNGQDPAMALDAKFLRVEFTGEQKTATEATFLLDDDSRKPFRSKAFRYTVVTPTSARVIAKTPTGHPLITLNKTGKGHVILTTTWYNLTDQKQRIVPVAERLLAYLTRQAMPVEVKGRIRYLVTRRDDGWVVALLNNKGIFKSSQADPQIDHLARQPVDIVLREPAKHVSEWTQPYTSWPFQVKDGQTHCGITVPSGDVRVLFFKTR